MTPDKIAKFTAAAKASGHKDDEIAQFIAEQSRAEANAPAPVAEEEPKKGFLQSVGEVFNRGLTQTIGMVTGAPKLGAEVAKADEQVKLRGDEMRKLALQARTETDPIKKQSLLAESRRLSSETEKLGAGATKATEKFQNKFDITDKDVEGGNTAFALKRGAKTAIDTGIMLMPSSKLIKTVGGASKIAKVTSGAINSAITGATISALDEATTLEDITPEERFQRTVDAGLWGAGIGGVMGAGGETFKLVKDKLFADKKISQQVAMMFTPKTSDKLRFENSFGASFEDEFKQRDLVALSALAKKGQVTEKEIAQYMESKSKEFITTKKELLKTMTSKTGGAPKEKIVETLRRVASEWAVNNELSPEDVKALNQKIKIIANSKQATIPWEKVDDFRSQFGSLGEAAYKLGGKESIFANAETAIRNMVEEAGSQVGNIKALNKGINYYILAGNSIASKGANELKKVANDITQFTLQTLPIMAAGGLVGQQAMSGNLGSEDFAVAGGTIGAVALGKGLRLNMASPAGRLKMASWLEKNAAKLTQSPKLIQELIQRIGNSSVIKTGKDLMMGTPEPAPTPTIEPLPTTAPGMENVTAQAPGAAEQMFDVKDSKTGKVTQVPQSQLSKYGINVPTAGASEGTMTKEEVTQNIIAAAQAGDSKGVTRWTAALDALVKAGPAADKKTEAQRSADAATGIAKSALADFTKGGIKTGPLALVEEGKSKLGTQGSGDEKTIKFNVKITSLKAMIAKARAGTSFTANEEKMLNRYTPTIGDTSQQLRIKLEMLANPEDPDLMTALTKVGQVNNQPVVQ